MEQERKITAHICEICKKPRLIEWSGNWSPVERLFLIALLAKIQRHEKGGEKKRIDVIRGWEDATPDADWMMQITGGGDLYNDFADLVARTVLLFDPDVNFADWLQKIERRFAQ